MLMLHFEDCNLIVFAVGALPVAAAAAAPTAVERRFLLVLLHLRIKF